LQTAENFSCGKCLESTQEVRGCRNPFLQASSPEFLCCIQKNFATPFHGPKQIRPSFMPLPSQVPGEDPEQLPVLHHRQLHGEHDLPRVSDSDVRRPGIPCGGPGQLPPPRTPELHRSKSCFTSEGGSKHPHGKSNSGSEFLKKNKPTTIAIAISIIMNNIAKY